MEKRDPQGRDDQSNPEVFPVPYDPWFVARSLKGRLFQLWMVAFFLLTYVVVSSDIGSQSLVLGLPGNMEWIYLGEICTIAVLLLIYYTHWQGWAHSADQQVRRVLDEERSAADGDEETKNGPRGVSSSR